MKTSGKIQGNKITSYFKISSTKPLKMKSSSDMNVKNKENSNLTNIYSNKQVISEGKGKNESDYDSDCYIIDEKPLPSISLGAENDIEAPQPSTVFVSQTECKISEEDEKDNVIPDDNIDELLIEASQYENDVNKPEEDAYITLSQQTSITQNPQYTSNYATEFFMQMVSDFLSKPCLHYLLSEQEINLTQEFVDLDHFEMKNLFVRLYWRQWKWQKVENIQKYINYDCRSEFVKNFLKNLEAKGFIMTGSQMDFDEYLEIASVPQLKKLMTKFPKKIRSMPSGKPQNKEAMVQSIREACNSNNDISKSFIRKGEVPTVKESLVKKMNVLLSNYIKIHESAKRTFDLLHSLMYLGANPQLLRDKKLNLMLLNVKNGKQFYPAMELECDTPSCIYPSRLQFLEYGKAYSLAETILQLTTVKLSNPDSDLRAQQVVEACRKCHAAFKHISQHCNFVDWKPFPWLHRFTPGYQYVRAMELSIKVLKTFHSEDINLETLEVLQTLLDQTTYREHKRAMWYHEQISILMTRQNDFTGAAELLILALSEPTMSEDEKAPLRDKAERLVCQKSVKIDTHVVGILKGLSKVAHIDIPSIDIAAKGADGNVRGRKAWYYFDDKESGDRKYTSVENYALLYYHFNTDYDCGEHWEGRIVTSIFGLLFWDIIYSTVKGKGLFLSRYQELPLDMYTPYFYENRKELIDERLAFIETSSLDDVLGKMKSALDTRKPGDFSLHSDHLVWEQLSTVSCCLGNAGLHSICKRLAHTYHYAHSGFPDLTIWNSQTKQIKFVEVKGEGDKLSFKQTQWIHYLIDSNVGAEVCYVHRNDKKFRKIMLDKLTKASNNVTEVDQNKIKAGSKRKNNKDSIVTEKVDINSIDRVEISKHNLMEISEDSIGIDGVQISKDPIATEKAAISKDKIANEFPKEEKVDSVNEQNCKSIKVTSPDLINHKNQFENINIVKTASFTIGNTNTSPIKTGNLSITPQVQIPCQNANQFENINIVKTASFTMGNTNTSPIKTGNLSITPQVQIPCQNANLTCSQRIEASQGDITKQRIRNTFVTDVLDSPVIDLTGLESPTKEENKVTSSPAKVAMHARRRLEGFSSPGSSNSSNQEEGVYLRSPSKISKGVGYFISPPRTPNNSISPAKAKSAKRKLSLSLTRRRLQDIDK